MDYHEHADDLAAAGLEHSPATYQARFCALWCLSEALDPEAWVAAVLTEEKAITDPELARNGLLSLVEETASELDDDQYSWTLVLPDDDTLIAERIAALAEWCDAFVIGLVQAALGERAPLAGEAREFVEDVQAIARVDEASTDSQDEAALLELVEYVRMGVIVLRGESLRARELH
jgi:uncharacterized protein